MALSPATVLRHDRTDERARVLFDQFKSAAADDGKWLPPELL